MDKKEEINVVFDIPVNDDRMLLGVITRYLKFEDERSLNKTEYKLSVFFTKDGSVIHDKSYVGIPEINKILRWCDSKNSTYQNRFYMDGEDKQKLKDFIIEFYGIDDSYFDTMEYIEIRKDYRKILKELGSKYEQFGIRGDRG